MPWCKQVAQSLPHQPGTVEAGGRGIREVFLEEMAGSGGWVIRGGGRNLQECGRANRRPGDRTVGS